MKSNESIRCSNSIICGDSTVCGKYTLNDDMQVFFVNNVGILNSGWMPTGDTSTGYEYLYVNVENVNSPDKTLIITRIKNDILVDVADIYGTKLDFNATTGKLSLIGRDGEKVLNTVQLSSGLALTEIVPNNDDHTITFKFNNTNDIVINLVEVLGGIEGLTDNKISTHKNNRDAILKVDEGNAFVSGLQGDLPLYPDLKVTTDTTITLRNNMERVLEGTTTSAIFKLEKDASLQGFCAVVVFTTGINPHITFDNQSGKTIVYIKENQKFQEITGLFSPRYQYNLFVLCNGINIEVYIQEIAI